MAQSQILNINCCIYDEDIHVDDSHKQTDIWTWGQAHIASHRTLFSVGASSRNGVGICSWPNFWITRFVFYMSGSGSSISLKPFDVT